MVMACDSPSKADIIVAGYGTGNLYEMEPIIAFSPIKSGCIPPSARRCSRVGWCLIRLADRLRRGSAACRRTRCRRRVRRADRLRRGSAVCRRRTRRRRPRWGNAFTAPFAAVSVSPSTTAPDSPYTSASTAPASPSPRRLFHPLFQLGKFSLLVCVSYMFLEFCEFLLVVWRQITERHLRDWVDLVAYKNKSCATYAL